MSASCSVAARLPRLMSLGLGVDASLTAAQCARHVIAQINDQMPRTYGDSFIHVSSVDAFVESSRPLSEYLSSPSHRLQRAIARNVAGLIAMAPSCRPASAEFQMPCSAC